MADLSLESSFDITADLIEATPIEKCSLNPRRGRNSRRLLTGFIIYASEVRKQVVEQYPDQNFGFISKLVGDKWRALTTDLRFKYHQRALIHNKRIKEIAAREGVSLGDIDLANGSVIKAPKITKKKLAKLAKQDQKRLNDSSESTTPNYDKSSLSPDTSISKRLNGTNNNINPNQQQSGTAESSTTTTPSTVTKNYSNYSAKQADNHYVQANNHIRSHSKKVNTVDTSTQTPSIRFVEPPPKKRLTYSDAFLKRLEELQRQCEQRMLQQ